MSCCQYSSYQSAMKGGHMVPLVISIVLNILGAHVHNYMGKKNCSFHTLSPTVIKGTTGEPLGTAYLRTPKCPKQI